MKDTLCIRTLPLPSGNFPMVWKAGGFSRPGLRGRLVPGQGAYMELGLVLHRRGEAACPSCLLLQAQNVRLSAMKPLGFIS